jgi:sulfur carrier protein ThiS
LSESGSKQGGGLIKIISNQRQTVAELLQEMGLEQEFFAVLIDGKKANLNEEVEKGTKIIVLPKIKGG